MNMQYKKRLKSNLQSNLQRTYLSKQSGFSLVEALIGFLILSIGMLGIASLQATSLKAGKTSVYGSVAMIKVEELFESMRANPTVLANYAAGGAGTGTASAACSSAGGCAYATLAADDIFWWKRNITAGLPDSVTTSVKVNAAAAPSRLAEVTVTVNWDERNKDAAGSSAKSYSATANICTAVPC